MVDGQQVDQAMPQGSTVSPQNGQQAPQEGIPQEMQSPLTMGQMGGGYNLLYLARRAATTLGSMPDAQKFGEMNRMKMSNPQLYQLVLRLQMSEQGSLAAPLDPQQSPLPVMKPSRRAAPVA